MASNFEYNNQKVIWEELLKRESTYATANSRKDAKETSKKYGLQYGTPSMRAKAKVSHKSLMRANNAKRKGGSGSAGG